MVTNNRVAKGFFIVSFLLFLATCVTSCASLLPRPLPQEVVYVDCMGRLTVTPTTVVYKGIETEYSRLRGGSPVNLDSVNRTMRNYRPDTSNSWVKNCVR